MDSQHQELIDLKSKVSKVVGLWDELKAENTSLKEEKESLKKQVLNKENQANEFEDKINKLKLAKTLGGNVENTSEAKQKITRIVREIDKCIALLNR